MDQLPEYLNSTFLLLSKAFHKQLKQDEYEAVMRILYDHMSDRSLAKIISYFTKKDYSFVLNDVYRIGSEYVLKKNVYNEVLQKLETAGFNDWIKEE